MSEACRRAGGVTRILAADWPSPGPRLQSYQGQGQGLCLKDIVLPLGKTDMCGWGREGRGGRGGGHQTPCICRTARRIIYTHTYNHSCELRSILGTSTV